MGNYLSEPITEKETEDGGQEGGPRFGAAAMQGWRVRMEDAHVANLAVGDPQERLSLFAVFDGHGGPEVAQYCADHVAEVLLDTQGFKEGNWEGALTQSFLTLDRRLAGEEGQRELGERVRAEKERSRERVRGREPEVTLEDVAEQTGLSQASIRQYVLAAWRRRPATEEEEEGGGQVSSLPAAGEGAAAVVAADLSAVGAKRQREEEEGDGAEKEENDEEGGEDTTAATTSDVSSSGSSSSSSSSSSNGSADSQVAPLPSSDAIEGEGREEGEEVVVLVEETEVITAEVTVTEISGSSGSSGEEDEEDEDEDGEEAALRRIDFRRVKDQLMRARPGYDSGCTAVVALLQGPREALVVANAGDSRCVLSRRGRAVDLSRDHKPDDPGELERIRAAGGSVAQGRVNGNLNLSRSLGDLTYKDARLAPARQMITAHPEVRRVPLEPTDEFAVLACDGVWNVLTSQQVVDHVRSGLARGVPLSALCEELCDRCCDQDMDESDGSGLDNISVVIVALPSASASSMDEAGPQQQLQQQQQREKEEQQQQSSPPQEVVGGPAVKRAKPTTSLS